MNIKFNKTLVRMVLVSLYALAVPALVKLTITGDVIFLPPFPRWIFLCVYLFFFNLNSEGNFAFDRYLNKKIPWFYFPRKRLLLQSCFIFGWSLTTLGVPFTTWYFLNGRSLIYPPFSVFVFIASVVMLTGFIGVSLTINFFRQWKTTLLEVEHLEQEKLKLNYKVLQNQVNPHFLFNSLNVLISEIRHNPDTAETFTRKLSLMYRYVLQSKNHDLIPLNNEIEFIYSYIYLNQVRVGTALNVSIDIDDEAKYSCLPPITLQILIENAMKHNVMNEENPLYITMETPDRHTLVVKNNLNPKQSFNSTQTGLSNIKARYKLIHEDGFKTEKKETQFIATVPLLVE